MAAARLVAGDRRVSGGEIAAARRAVEFVAARSRGVPVDPTWRVTVNFHPDRPSRDGTDSVLAALAADGVYRSQFTTGTGNGGLSAHRGGDRWHWESEIFGGVYDEAPLAHRPVYGALDYRRDPVGAAPRFGSAHLRLTPETLSRTTFCYPDSYLHPTDFGVAERMSLTELTDAAEGDPLDRYIEAHIHGDLRLDRDVEAIVLDPSHRDTPIEATATRLPCPIEWHPGFHLTVDRLRRHPDYRGIRYTELAASVARDNVLTPHILGTAARTGQHDPQALKKVWHYLARFGTGG